MIRFPLIVLTGLAASLAAPAQAQLRDVLVVDQGGAAHLWLAFDAQPRSAALEGGALHVMGVSDAARAITPAGPAPFTGLTVSPEAGGLRLDLHGASWISAELREGGIWAQLDAPAGYAAPAPRVSATAPDQPPAMTPPEGEGAGAPVQDQTALPDPAAQPQASTPPATPPPPATPGAIARAALTRCADSAQALEDAPWDLDLIAAHGACLTGAGDAQAGGEQFERVLAFDPDNPRAALGLARVLEARGEHARAADLYEIAARGARTDGEALAAMAAARRLRGDN